jgi:N-acetylglucosaminylphosphatidylinositol deacetylase
MKGLFYFIVLNLNLLNFSMFFAPSLFNLALYGINLYLISITSGNSEGLGHVRAKELFAAAEIYGIPKSQVHFLDPEERFFPDGFHGWNITNLSMALFPMISKIQPHGIITFDKWGISGHPNHEAAFHSLEMLKDGGNFTSIPQLFALETVPLWRKYSTFLDVFYTQLDCLFTGHTREHFHMIWTQPFGYYANKTWCNNNNKPFTCRVYHAMAQHRSQLIWFRYLYMAFSRYVYVNTFVSII